MKNALIEIEDALLQNKWAKALDLANEFGPEAMVALYQAVASLSESTE